MITYLGLNISMSLACLVSRASLLTLGRMHHKMAFTLSSCCSPMNLRMSLKVLSSYKNKKKSELAQINKTQKG